MPCEETHSYMISMVKSTVVTHVYLSAFRLYAHNYLLLSAGLQVVTAQL